MASTKKKKEVERGTRSLQRSEEKICNEHGLSNEQKKVVEVILHIVGQTEDEATEEKHKADDEEKGEDQENTESGH
jgi:hypothetical protein